MKFITYSSKQLIENLKQYDLHQKKSTKEVPFINIKDELIKHYIRGIIDGDGYISKKELRIGACGSIDVMTFIKEYLVNKLDLDENKDLKLYLDKKYKNLYRIYSNRNTTLKIIEFLYKDANIYLNRKYKLAMEKLNGHV